MHRTATFLAILLLAVTAFACAPMPARNAQVLVLGDSILAWNRFSGRDVGSLVGDRTGLTVRSLATNGANFITERGFPIPLQYQPGPWDYVILNGGGNDIAKVCLNPRASARVVDTLIGPDLSGAYAKLVDTIRADGPQIIILGYPPVSLRGGPFAPCAAALDLLSQRQAQFAALRPGVAFVDARDVIAPEDLQAYGIDRVHPTPYATNLMAGQIAGTIAQLRNR